MRLASPALVLSILGLQSGPGTLAMAGAALDATFPALEAILDTKLVEGECTDYYSLATSQRTDPVLRLTNGFVSKEATITIRQTLAGEALGASGGSEVDLSLASMHYTLGTLLLAGEYYPGRFTLAVTYTFGFPLDLSNPDTLTGAPDEIVQAHANLAAAFIQMNPTNVSKEKAKALGVSSSNGYDMRARQGLYRFARSRGTVIWPDFVSYSE